MYFRYSPRCLLKDFPDSKKYKISGNTLNHYQKPLLLFMKHIMCWSNYGDLIIDATSGTWTLAVSIHYFLVFFKSKIIRLLWIWLILNTLTPLIWIRDTGCVILACFRLVVLHYSRYFQGENLCIRQNSQGWRNANIVQEAKVHTHWERCPSIQRTRKQNLRLGKGKSDPRIQPEWEVSFLIWNI